MLHRENRIKQYHTSSAADLLKEVMGYYGITQSDLAKYLTEILALRIEKVMGIPSKLLLSLDSNYKLQLAEQESKLNKEKGDSPLFLQRYSWVTV